MYLCTNILAQQYPNKFFYAYEKGKNSLWLKRLPTKMLSLTATMAKEAEEIELCLPTKILSLTANKAQEIDDMDCVYPQKYCL